MITNKLKAFRFEHTRTTQHDARFNINYVYRPGVINQLSLNLQNQYLIDLHSLYLVQNTFQIISIIFFKCSSIVLC